MLADSRFSLGDQITHPERITSGVGEAGIDAVGTELFRQPGRHSEPPCSDPEVVGADYALTGTHRAQAAKAPIMKPFMASPVAGKT